MTATAILIVDDEKDFTEILRTRLARRGYAVTTAGDGDQALQSLRNNEEISVVVLDLVMPGLDGLTTLAAIKTLRPLVEVIILTGRGSVAAAVDAVKKGAFNYLQKPCDIDDLAIIIAEARQHREMRQKKILEVRMDPYLSGEKRQEMIAAILRE
jgi:DNA-binding NtrC family response regulator